MNPFAFFLAIADKVHTALNLLDPTRTYAAADALWARQRGAEGLAEKEAGEGVSEPREVRDADTCDMGDEEPGGPILVRAWNNGYGADPIMAFVDDWDNGHFSIPADHPFSALVPHVHKTTIPLTVFSTDELEWTINRVDTGFNGHHFACRPRLYDLRRSLISDDHLIWMWLEAEKRATTSAAPASQTDAPGEASGVPEGVSTPDPDAPSGHLTLGNDPQSVHERALRQRTNEDRNPQRKGNAHA